jgi:hypothetical protein
MHHRSYRFISRVLVSSALLAGLALPASASAQTYVFFQQCAVMSSLGAVVTVWSPNWALNHAAAVCTDMIQSGFWFGITRDVDFNAPSSAYRHMCYVSTRVVSEAWVYHVYWSDQASRVDAAVTCVGADNATFD